MTNRSLHNLSPNFSIPPGTQVVLKQDQVSDDRTRKAGTVGVVIKSSPDNVQPYLIQFADETELSVPFEALVIRRLEVDHLLIDQSDPATLRPWIIFQCQVGSHAFGLASESSDNDVRGIFLPPARQHWSLYQLPEQLEFKEGDDDEVYWELEKYIKLALKANPNILETLWTPRVLFSTPIADRLREIRRAFLSKHVYKTYSGYVLSQFRRMKNSVETKGTYKTKHAMHLIRLLHSGINVMRSGEIMVDVSEHRENLLAIKAGDYSFEEVRSMAFDLDNQFKAAFEKSNLPDQPDFETVNNLLIDARKSMVDEN